MDRKEVFVQINKALFASDVRVDDMKLTTMHRSEIFNGEFAIEPLSITLMYASFVFTMIEK
jgi:hypothetical protein